MATMSAVRVQSATAISSFSVSKISCRKCALPMKIHRRNFSVRAELEDNVEKPVSSAPAPAIPSPPVTKPSVRKASTKFGDIFAFGGPAPETINGRLAMVGFIAALGVELASGAPLSRQIADPISVSWFLFFTSLFSAASLIPLFQGIRVESKSGGVFTSNAETWNGRAAMLGLVALAITEFVSGSALV